MPQSAVISSASGETAFEPCPSGMGTISLKGTMSAGKIVVAVRPPGAASDYISDYINVATLQETPDEAGTGYAFVARFDAGVNASVALKADTNFVGSVTAQVNGDPF